jgi:hypothetical protein
MRLGVAESLKTRGVGSDRRHSVATESSSDGGPSSVLHGPGAPSWALSRSGSGGRAEGLPKVDPKTSSL